MNHVCAYVKPQETAKEGVNERSLLQEHFPLGWSWLLFAGILSGPAFALIKWKTDKKKKKSSSGAGLLPLGTASEVEIMRCNAFSEDITSLPLSMSCKG